MENPNEVCQINNVEISASIMLYNMKLPKTMNCPYYPNETVFIEHFYMNVKNVYLYGSMYKVVWMHILVKY